MDTQAFINQVAAGDAVGAKDLLNDLLSAKAFEALDAKKVEMAQSLYIGKQEEPEVQETEEAATEE